MRQKAFTLAEVLITLGIIGVIAAMTIPTLIQNTQKEQYITSLKKAYAQLNQAMAQVINDYNCSGNIVCTGLGSSALATELSQKFKTIKYCGTGLNECFSVGYVTDWSWYYDGSNKNTGSNLSGGYKFITTDGISYNINYYGFCNDNSALATGNMSQMCGWIAIDTNGLKGPNNFGRDLWEFWIGNGKGVTVLYPVGGSEWPSNYWKTNNHCTPAIPYAFACPGRIVEESWQMNY